MTDVESFNIGNCIPLENIDISHYSSSDLIKTINICTTNINTDLIFTEENVEDVDSYIKDHHYIYVPNMNISDFCKEIIIYISGFVIHKLSLIIFIVKYA